MPAEQHGEVGATVVLLQFVRSIRDFRRRAR
jgi:hypothetical protein